MSIDQPIDQEARDRISVAPGAEQADTRDAAAVDAATSATDDRSPAQHPRQEAGQDTSIAERLARDPGNAEAQLDNALDETMDASDPPAITQPGSGDPAPSSGFDPKRHESD